MNINIGLPEEARQEIAHGLSKVLADSYTLYLKTHNFHWNVTGPMFTSLHVLFEEHYTELATAVDQIAERIRALGIRAPGSYSEFAKLTSIKEASGKISATEMLQQLVDAHETLIRGVRDLFPVAADNGDEATVDLLTGRLDIHEKTAWMLRSLLEK